MTIVFLTGAAAPAAADQAGLHVLALLMGLLGGLALFLYGMDKMG